MANQAGFSVVLAGFLAVFASGAFAPCGASSILPEDSGNQQSAPLQVGVTVNSDLRVQQTQDPAGSSSDASSQVQVATDTPARTAPPYPLALNQKVEHFLDRFTTSRRELVNLWLNRSNRYLGMMREILRSRGLPEDLAFTAMIESGFNPVAVSRAGAAGLWQFMAGTARRYGLRVDAWVDERFDPEKSTFAAASYLGDLYKQFGSWPLAHAAYNAGEVKVVRAIRETGSKDFWVLANSEYLRQETKEFVPQIHAVTVIGRDPDRYGFQARDLVVTSFETIPVPGSTDLRWLAGSAGLSYDDLRVLNPALFRGVTPPGAPYTLKVPLGTGPGVLLAVDTARDSSAVTRSQDGRVIRAGRKSAVQSAAGGGAAEHVVRPRDTVTSIARHYGVGVNDVLRWNSLEHDHTLRPGDRLRVVDRHPGTERERRPAPR